MKTIKQLIEETLFLTERFRGYEINNIAHALRAAGVPETSSERTKYVANNDQVFQRPTPSAKSVLGKLTPEALGSLFGDCINIFRDKKDINYINVRVPKNNQSKYTITNIFSAELSGSSGENYDDIILNRNYFEKHFPIVKVKNVINEILRNPSSYKFASYADPTPHTISSDMITTHKIREEKVKQYYNRETRLPETKRERVDTGETKEVKALSLYTTNTGRGIVRGKRGNAMDVGKASRRTGEIKNFYYVNGGADCCIHIDNTPFYAISIKRSESTLYESSSASAARGSIKSVYIFKDLSAPKTSREAKERVKVAQNKFTHPDFLAHLTRTLNLAPKEYKISAKAPNEPSTTPANNTFLNNKLKNSRVGNKLSGEVNNALRALSNIPQGTIFFNKVSDKIWNLIMIDRPNLDFSREEFALFPEHIKNKIKKYQQIRNKQKRENDRFFGKKRR